MDYTKERKYLPEFVYGSIDGTISTFAVVTGSIGASLSPSIILILGFANLIADGFSMAVSSYLSTKSRTDMATHKKTKLTAKSPQKIGLATFLSFILIGIIPLISFVLAWVFPKLEYYQFGLSFAFTAIALSFVGAIKGFVTRKHPFLSSLETLVIGGIAASLAFLAGYFIKSIIG